MIRFYCRRFSHLCPLSSFLDTQQCAGRQQGPGMVIILTPPARKMMSAVPQRTTQQATSVDWKSDESHPQINEGRDHSQ